MKTSPISLRAAAAALFLGAAGAQASTVTLTFSSAITALATNWGNSDDAGGEAMTWGVIIDTTGNGFSVNYLPSSIDFTQSGTAQSLSNPGGALTDDVLFIATSPMMVLLGTPTDGAVAGQNRISSIVNAPEGVLGISEGDPFMIVWFDRTQGGAVTPAGAPVAGDRFGIFADPGYFAMPPDASTQFYTAPFVGPDPLKLMNRSFVPEPSAAGLALLGAAGLVRRRR